MNLNEQLINTSGTELTLDVIDIKKQSKLERSDNVLWSLSPIGIVLHNVESGSYLEVNNLGYLIWGYLDGARSVEEVKGIIHKDLAIPRESAEMTNIIKVFFSNGFIVERNDAQ